jgi:hypothetical protein
MRNIRFVMVWIVTATLAAGASAQDTPPADTESFATASGFEADYSLQAARALQSEAAAVSPIVPQEEVGQQGAESTGLNGRLQAMSPLAELVDYQSPSPDSEPVSSGYFSSLNGVREGKWNGGVSAFVLKPHWTGGNIAYLDQNISTGIYSATSFATPYSAAPAFWFGYETRSGDGIQFNYFQYSQTSNVNAVVPDGHKYLPSLDYRTTEAGETFTAGSGLKITTLDLEVTKRVQAWNWDWTATAGLRYLHLAQNYFDGFEEKETTNNSFNGVGPTMSLGGRRPIGGSGLGFYSSARGALVFGQQHAFASYFSQNSQSNTWGVIPTAQVQFGVDYRRQLWGNRATLVIENGLIGQVFFNVGTPNSVTNIPWDLYYNTATASTTSSLGLFGLRSSFGISF